MLSMSLTVKDFTDISEDLSFHTDLIKLGFVFFNISSTAIELPLWDCDTTPALSSDYVVD